MRHYLSTDIAEFNSLLENFGPHTVILDIAVRWSSLSPEEINTLNSLLQSPGPDFEPIDIGFSTTTERLASDTSYATTAEQLASRGLFPSSREEAALPSDMPVLDEAASSVP